MAKYLNLPDGTSVEVPDEMDYLTAIRAARQKFPEAFGAAPAKEQPKGGFFAALKGQGARGLADVALVGEKLGLAPDQMRAYQQSLEDYAQRTFKPSEEGWGEAPWTKFKETLGGSAYYAAPALGVAALPTGVLPTAAGLGIVAGASALNYTGSNLRQQMEAGKTVEETDLAKAALTSVPQTAIDLVALRMIPGLRSIFGEAAGKITNEQAKKMAEEALRKTAADYALQTGKAVTAEGLNEVATQALARAQAGMSLTDEDARKDFFENFMGGASFGTVFGPMGRFKERSRAIGEYKTEEAMQQAAAEKQQRDEAEAAATTPDALMALHQQYTEEKAKYDALTAAKKAPLPKGATPEDAIAKTQAIEAWKAFKDDPAWKELNTKRNKYDSLIKPLLQQKQDAEKAAAEQRAQQLERDAAAMPQEAQTQPYFQEPQQTLPGMEAVAQADPQAAAKLQELEQLLATVGPTAKELAARGDTVGLAKLKKQKAEIEKEQLELKARMGDQVSTDDRVREQGTKIEAQLAKLQKQLADQANENIDDEKVFKLAEKINALKAQYAPLKEPLAKLRVLDAQEKRQQESQQDMLGGVPNTRGYEEGAEAKAELQGRQADLQNAKTEEQPDLLGDWKDSLEQNDVLRQEGADERQAEQRWTDVFGAEPERDNSAALGQMTADTLARKELKLDELRKKAEEAATAANDAKFNPQKTDEEKKALRQRAFAFNTEYKTALKAFHENRTIIANQPAPPRPGSQKRISNQGQLVLRSTPDEGLDLTSAQRLQERIKQVIDRPDLNNATYAFLRRVQDSMPENNSEQSKEYRAQIDEQLKLIETNDAQAGAEFEPPPDIKTTKLIRARTAKARADTPGIRADAGPPTKDEVATRDAYRASRREASRAARARGADAAAELAENRRQAFEQGLENNLSRGEAARAAMQLFPEQSTRPLAATAEEQQTAKKVPAPAATGRSELASRVRVKQRVSVPKGPNTMSFERAETAKERTDKRRNLQADQALRQQESIREEGGDTDQLALFPAEEKKLGTIKEDRAAFERLQNSPFVRNELKKYREARTALQRLPEQLDKLNKLKDDLAEVTARVMPDLQLLRTMNAELAETAEARKIVERLGANDSDVLKIKQTLTKLKTLHWQDAGAVEQLLQDIGKLRREGGATKEATADAAHIVEQLEIAKNELAFTEAQINQLEEMRVAAEASRRVARAKKALTDFLDAEPQFKRANNQGARAQYSSELKRQADMLESELAAARKAVDKQNRQVDAAYIAAEKESKGEQRAAATEARIAEQQREEARVKQQERDYREEQRRIEAFFASEAQGEQFTALTEEERARRESIVGNIEPLTAAEKTQVEVAEERALESGRANPKKLLRDVKQRIREGEKKVQALQERARLSAVESLEIANPLKPEEVKRLADLQQLRKKRGLLPAQKAVLDAAIAPLKARGLSVKAQLDTLQAKYNRTKSAEERSKQLPALEEARRRYDTAVAKALAEVPVFKGQGALEKRLLQDYVRLNWLNKWLATHGNIQTRILNERPPNSLLEKMRAQQRETRKKLAEEAAAEAAQRANAPATSGEALTRTQVNKARKQQATSFYPLNTTSNKKLLAAERGKQGRLDDEQVQRDAALADAGSAAENKPTKWEQEAEEKRKANWAAMLEERAELSEKVRLTAEGGRSDPAYDFGDASWRMGDGTGGIDLPSAQKRMDELQKTLPKGMKVIYAATPETAPRAFWNAAAAHGIDADALTKAKGVTLADGTIIVVGEHHSSLRDLEETIAHEMIGHYAVDSVLGADGMKTLLERANKHDGGLVGLADELNVGTQVREAIKIAEEQKDPDAQLAGLKELIAYTSEQRVTESFRQKASRWIKELIGAVREAFRKMGLAEFAKADTNDIYKVLRDAHRAFKNGDIGAARNYSGGTRFRTGRVTKELAGAYAISQRVVAPQASWAQKLDSTITGRNLISLNAEVNFVDQFAPFERITRGMKDALAGVQMMYYLRMTGQRHNLLSQIIGHGPLELKEIKRKDGRKEWMYQAQENGPNLANVNQTLGAAHKLTGSPQVTNNLFSLYSIAKRAENVGLDKLDYSGKLTQADLNTAVQQIRSVPGLQSVFDKAHDEYQKVNRGLLDFAVQTGYLSEAKAKEFMRNDDYVPYYREDSRGGVGMFIGGEEMFKIGNVRDESWLAPLVGDNNRVIDFNTAAVANANMWMELGLRNQAAKNAAYQLSSMGMGTVGAKHSRRGPDVFNFRDKGVEKHVLVQTGPDIPAELLVKGMEGIPVQMSALVRLLGVPSQWVRTLFVANPVSAVRNLFRDVVSSTVTAGSGFDGTLAAMRNVGAATLTRRGVAGGEVFTGLPSDMANVLREIQTGTEGSISKLFTKGHIIHSKADAFARQLRYESYIKQGLSDMEATYMALESMNFTRRGVSPSIHLLNTLNPFINAQIQGVSVISRAIRGKMPMNQRLEIRNRLITRGLMIAGLSMMYAALMQDDETYKNATPEQRYGNWFLPNPFGGEMIRAPIPFEVGALFKAIPEALVNYMQGKDEDAYKGLMFALKQLIPGYSTYGIPQALRPAIEAVSGYSFYTGRSLESRQEQTLVPGMRTRPNTSGLLDVIGEQLNISPIRLQQLISGYTGTLGLAVTQIAGMPFKDGAEMATARTSQMPLTGTFFQPVDAGGVLNQAYEVMQEAKQVRATFDNLVAKGRPDEARAFLERNATAFARASMADSFEGVQNKLTQQVRAVQNSNLSPDKKRELLDKLQKVKTDQAAAILRVATQVDSTIHQGARP